jgi:hypothetical protein
LSRHGIELLVKSKIEVGDSVELQIHSDELEIDVVTAATVCGWGHQAEETWVIGCIFAKPISSKIVHAFVDSGYFERRKSLRRRINVGATVLCLHESLSMLEVQLDDYSTGGFRMSSPKSFSCGECFVLLMRCDEASSVQVPAEVRWQTKQRSGFSVGCSFTTPDGSEVFQAALRQVHAANRALQQMPKLPQAIL